MIIGQRARIVDGERFALGLARALRAVVRVSVGEGSVSACTGWTLTPSIVVIPAYLVASGEATSPVPIKVERIKNGRVAWQARSDGEIEILSGEGLEAALNVALVRLRQQQSIPRLELNVTLPEPGALVSLLSFAGGRPTIGMSPGTLLSADERSLTYDADSEPGSGGAPVFDEQWRVIGMHMMAVQESRSNRGVSPAALIGMLQRSRHWEEIARYQKLADVAAGRKQLEESATTTQTNLPEKALIRAAVRLSLRPSELSEATRAALRDKVINPEAKEWTLQPGVRRKVILAAGSLDVLRKEAPRSARSAGQRVIGRVLDGPPYDLSKEDEESLSWWIQAVRWFADVVAGLPSPADVARVLERRRIRSRLEDIAGRDFQGRAAELRKMRKWFRSEPAVPLSITGIGGVGKSALVARFASSLPAETLLFWLDFDRADLAPDDAVSVLTALGRQADVQLDGFSAPDVSPEKWEDAAHALGKKLAERAQSHPPLLVLDSFEVAQYAERYQELWPVLEKISAHLPALRVIVSGRAPVSNLQLRGQKAEPLPLTGLRPADARAWLERHGIRGAKVVDRVLELSQCLPLILHLAHRLVKAGGRVRDLPKKLPPEILAGFLYDRILDRVQNPVLRPVATAALALRRLTEPMILPVFGGGLVKLPPGEPSKWFRELSREATLVEGSEVLKLREEVRSAALRLLERDEAKLVRSVDERAEQWYSTQDTNDPDIAAELVYHRLRLGMIDGAAAAWREGCAWRLQYADDDLRTKAERSWLQARLGSGTIHAVPVSAWEQEAAERIRASRVRGLGRAVHSILLERKDRSDDSALVFHEAYEMRAAGQTKAALHHLVSAGEGSRAVARERALLQALLLADLGRKKEADAALRRIEAPELWSDRLDGEMELLAVQAARLRLATDFEAELELIGMSQGSRVEPFWAWISPIDVVLPRLADLLGKRSGTGERSWTVAVPGGPNDLGRFAADIERFRTASLPDEPLTFRELRARVSGGQYLSQQDWPPNIPAPLARTLESGWRRWAIGATSMFFLQVQTAGATNKGSPFTGSIAAGLALFAALEGLSLHWDNGPLAGMPLYDLVFRMTASSYRKELRMYRELPFGPKPKTFERILNEGVGSEWRSGLLSQRSNSVTFHIVAPDPLLLLVERFAGKEPAEV